MNTSQGQSEREQGQDSGDVRRVGRSHMVRPGYLVTLGTALLAVLLYFTAFAQSSASASATAPLTRHTVAANTLIKPQADRPNTLAMAKDAAASRQRASAKRSDAAARVTTKESTPTRLTTTHPATPQPTVARPKAITTSKPRPTTKPRPSTRRPTPTKPKRSPQPKLANPTANIAPSPDFLQSGTCTGTPGDYSCANPCLTSTLTWPTFTNNAACTNYVLAAINNARTTEGLGPMVLPSNWLTLTTPEQLFVVANLERTARGLPAYVGLNAALSAEAQRAASANADPTVAPGFAIGNDAEGVPGMGGAWAAGFSVLAADYMWMYDDGWGGNQATTSNVACTSASSAGCWAHRDELLGSDPGFNPGVGLNCSDCEMGAGYAVVNGQSSYVDLIELPAASAPPVTFTWASELAVGA